MTKNRPQHAPTVESRSVFLAIIGTLLLSVALAIPAARASDSAAEAPVSSVPVPLVNNFSIFRTPSEVVPPEIAKAAATFNAQPPPLGGHGFNAALGQEVVLPGKHAPLWGVPGRDQVMLWDQPRQSHFGGTTTMISRAVKRGVIFSTGVPKTHDPHLMRVKGLVPDGVTSVKLSKTAVAQVVDNAFTRKVAQAKLWEGQDWIFMRAKGPIAELP
jgi:hypothetical protein